MRVSFFIIIENGQSLNNSNSEKRNFDMGTMPLLLFCLYLNLYHTRRQFLIYRISFIYTHRKKRLSTVLNTLRANKMRISNYFITAYQSKLVISPSLSTLCLHLSSLKDSINNIQIAIIPQYLPHIWLSVLVVQKWG